MVPAAQSVIPSVSFVTHLARSEVNVWPVIPPPRLQDPAPPTPARHGRRRSPAHLARLLFGDHAVFQCQIDRDRLVGAGFLNGDLLLAHAPTLLASYTSA